MEIQNYFEAPAGAYHLAEFTVYIPAMDWYIHRMQLKKNKQGGIYVGYPVYATGAVNQYGKKVWAPVSHPGTKRKAEFEKSVLDLVRPLMSGKDQTQAEKQVFSSAPAQSEKVDYGW